MAERDKADWRRGAVIYQIYPRSFRDSNDDGVGDLPGILERLDYVASLGVDGVWLSPFFTSPMRDFGYDVSDYCNVDPVFGTLSDLDKLVEKAHRLGLKVIIDQVYCHTSDEHAWFSESRRDKTNPKADWFVWAEAKPDGSPPNNWLSVFGGGAWEWDEGREQYYLHHFLKSQPALNGHNPKVQDALLGAARFWLDRGVDGFRLDAINFLMHDPKFRDNPPAPNQSAPRAFDRQLHFYNQSHKDIPKFLERLRKLTDQYDDIFTVAEVVGPAPVKEMKAFTGPGRLTTAYNFAFLYANTLTNDLFRKTLAPWGHDPNEGWPAWAFSNHDAPRVASRWGKGKELARAAKLYALLLMSLRGDIFLYQGEELGLPQGDVPFEELKDPEAIANWPHTLGRDGARTPMPWRRNAPYAGFSDAKPWLPVDARHIDLAVEAQESDESSILNFVRKLIAFRTATPALREGDLTFIDEANGLLAFRRKTASQIALCVFNLTDRPIAWTPPEGDSFTHGVAAGVDAHDNIAPEKLASLSGYIAVRN